MNNPVMRQRANLDRKFRDTFFAVALLCLIAPAARPGGTIDYQPYEYIYSGQNIHAQLGRLSVPENYEHPDGKSVTLAFVRLKSTASHPGPPIIYLAGGPGGSAIKLMRGPRGSVFLAMRAAGDVIALDQRGTGLAQPDLNCPGKVDFPLNEPGAYPEMLRYLIDASRRCASYWRSRSVDLATYNVVQNARDIDLVRQALGTDKICLWGSSYGTFLGFSILRHFGDHVSRAIFAGVEGPDDTLKLPGLTEDQLHSLSRMVAETSALHRQIPDFMTLLREVLTAARQRPFVVPVTGAERTVSITLGGADLEQLVAGMLGEREGFEKLPAMLLAFRNRQWLSPLIQSAAQEMIKERTGSIGTAMSLVMDCSSGVSPKRLAEITVTAKGTLLGSAMNFPFPEICSAWNVPQIPQTERMPAHSEVPVLFISGSLDGRTPVGNVEELLAGFPFGAEVVIDGAGHGNDLFISSPEITSLLLTFMTTGRSVTKRIVLPPLQFAALSNAIN